MTLQEELTHVEDSLAHLNKEDPCYYEEYENFACIKAYLVAVIGEEACSNLIIQEQQNGKC